MLKRRERLSTVLDFPLRFPVMYNKPMDGTSQDTKHAMQEAFDRFLKSLEEAEKEYVETTSNILRSINDRRIKEIREKLGLK